MSKKLTMIALFATVILGSVFIFGKAQALSGSQFKPGDIINDTIFYNSGLMSTDQIKSFLKSKVPNCDTNGTKAYGNTTRAAYGSSKGYPAPYTCLKDYSQVTASRPADNYCKTYPGGHFTSARIIYEVAKSCNISQKALIVLLEKEQSLITDDWPWSIQYRSATGYGCPDTAPCDSEYYGFFNQVYNAAKQFQRYKQKPQLFNFRSDRVSAIQYHPNDSCGMQDVRIQTHATAGLYNYTPYTPNGAALDSLYGTGNSCSSYGNRNFWRIYSDWFGSTQKIIPDEPLSGDWDGDGIDSFGVKRGNQYLLDNDNDGKADVEFVYGSPGNAPLVGDWDGDGTDTISLKIGDRYFINNQGLIPDTELVFSYGTIGDRPLAGDWDGNGTDTVSLKIGSRYFINNHLAPGTDHIFKYGNSGNGPVVGDWDGNNRDTIALKIGDRYFVNNHLHPGTDLIFSYGTRYDKPEGGDWDGDDSDTISLKIGTRFFVNNQLAPGTNTLFTFTD